MAWIVTSRLSRSISMPLRARSTSFLPSRLSAEYIGGVWRMRPTNREAACRTAATPGSGHFVFCGHGSGNVLRIGTDTEQD